MDNDTFNMSMRKFLKQVGVTSQQALEAHVRDAGLTSGTLPARVFARSGAARHDSVALTP